MFNEKDILTRLQNGESVQKIADEMAAAINKANETYLKEKAAAEREKEKVAELNTIVENFGKWLIKHYEIDEPLGHIDTTEIIEAIDELVKNLKALADLGKKPPVKNTDKTLDEFLKNMGW